MRPFSVGHSGSHVCGQTALGLGIVKYSIVKRRHSSRELLGAEPGPRFAFLMVPGLPSRSARLNTKRVFRGAEAHGKHVGQQSPISWPAGWHTDSSYRGNESAWEVLEPHPVIFRVYSWLCSETIPGSAQRPIQVGGKQGKCPTYFFSKSLQPTLPGPSRKLRSPFSWDKAGLGVQMVFVIRLE